MGAWCSSDVPRDRPPAGACYPDILVASPALGVLFVCFAAAASAQSSVLLDTMSVELDRNFSTLKAKADPAPYFLSYEVTEEDFHGVAATLVAITSNGQSKSRRLDVCVGSPNRITQRYRYCP